MRAQVTAELLVPLRLVQECVATFASERTGSSTVFSQTLGQISCAATGSGGSSSNEGDANERVSLPQARQIGGRECLSERANVCVCVRYACIGGGIHLTGWF